MNMQVCTIPTLYTTMNIDDDAKEHTAKKMKTMIALMAEALQMLPFKDNNKKNLENLEESSV
ncbi:33540_t:CDS:1, partial [Gigaspora margarita]